MRKSEYQPTRNQFSWQRVLVAMATMAFAVTLVPVTTLAQTDGEEEEQTAGALEEVLVTSARRREENLQDVPIAVSMLTDDILEDFNIIDLGDVSRIVPNSVISAGRGSNTTIIAYVRGVGQNDPLWGFEPGVGVGAAVREFSVRNEEVTSVAA